MTIRRKILSLLLAAAVTLTLTAVPLFAPLAASAADPVTYDLSTSGPVNIHDSGMYIITGASATNTISVTGGSPNITLENAEVDVSGTDNTCAFSVASGASVNLTLIGTNTLKSGTNCAGLQVPDGATLTITTASTGSLEATGGACSAGIGGCDDSSGNMITQSGGMINIGGGTITANGGNGGAGIGGGYCGNGGTVNISGGTVTAASVYSAGIGGGSYGSDGGTITISGGTVTATSGAYGAGIGGGTNGNGGKITISSGTVTATGGDGGAGIGGAGLSGKGGTITISGGTVTATGGDGGAGIGGGDSYGCDDVADGGTITISGGIVTATGGDHGAGIGGGVGDNGGTTNIAGSGTHVTATGKGGGYDIGSGASGAYGGSLTVGDTNTTAHLPCVQLSGMGTNAASPTYKNCVIVGSGAGSNEGVYDSNSVPTGPININTGLDPISGNGSYIITGTTTTNTITVEGGSPDIILENADIDVSGTDGACAFSIASGASCSLMLIGINTLKSASGCAGLQVPIGATLTVGAASTGTLSAGGGDNGAGIGGGNGGNVGTVNINGGTIKADGGGSSAGIGGGYKGNGGDITVTGSGTNVTAQGQNGGYDIGSGSDSTNGGNLTVGDASTMQPLPFVCLTNAGTNVASPTYKNCIISDSTGNPQKFYDAGGNVSFLYDISKGSVDLYGNVSYIIKGNGTATSNTISVASGSPKIILENADIEVSGCAFSIASSASCSLTLIGTNTLKSGNGCAGLQVPIGATLTVGATSTGSLDATGGVGGAGIGGSTGIGGGTINISGGTVTAKGGNGGAGIGGGDSGAGIGGGDSGAGGDVNITGSGTNVTAQGQNGGYDIGSGVSSISGGSLSVGDESTMQPLPFVCLKNAGTNVAFPTYQNCIISDSIGNPQKVYDANSKITPKYDISKQNVSIKDSGSYIITGRSDSNAVSVTGNVSPNIILENADIEVEGCAFSIASEASVSLMLIGNNKLESGNGNAGLQVPEGATLTIAAASTGSLESSGGSGAGIGGGNGGNGGTININGGTVTASGYGSAGIGGGLNGNGGTININGGTVNANSNSDDGASIGGGSGGNGGTINISGGTVTANSGVKGAGIGGGLNGNGGTINISGGTVTATSGNWRLIDGNGNTVYGNGGAGIGGGYCGNGGTVVITGSGTHVTARALNGGFDIGSGATNTIGGSLAVGNSKTIAPLPIVELTSTGTNAATNFKNCMINNSANDEMSGTYGANGYFPVTVELVSPVGLVTGGTVNLEADISGYSGVGKVQFSYKADGDTTFTPIGGLADVDTNTGKAAATFIPLAAGKYTIKAEYSSACGYHKGSDSKTLSVISTYSTLSKLTISMGTLTPAFASETMEYAAGVDYNTGIVTVTPTVNESHATVKVNGKPVTSGSASDGIALEAGKTTEIDVVVTAQDGTTTTTYKIQVTRGVYVPPYVPPAPPRDATITGSQNSDGSSTATISANYGNTSVFSNVTVNCGNTAFTFPSSVISGALGSGSSLTLTIGPDDAKTQSAINAAAAKSGVSPLFVFDLELIRHNADGTTEAVHDFSGGVTVTVKLTDAQLAAIKAGITPHIYYYDPVTGTLTDMNATFDLTNGTVTFTTNHFSTYVISVQAAEPTPLPPAANIGVTYDAHVQKIGWQKPVADGTLSGTTGKSLRLEALKINLTGDVPSGATITYQAHVQKIGWQEPVSNGAIAGTSGRCLRVEALKVTLSGLDGYQVKYRVYVQGKGWLVWQASKNGTSIDAAGIAGTTGKGLRIEAVQVVVEKV